MTAINIEQLRARVRGSVLQPEDAAYETARKVYNAMIDKRPAIIVQAVDQADVIEAVNFARTNSLLTAVRGGGHNGGGLGTCDDGLVIDLSRMKGIRVDPTARTVRVQGGCTGGDMDHATHAFGMATPGGTVSTTGVAGLTLGGGIGHLTRPYGLAIDSLLEVDVVLADGRAVTANARDNADLFWAVRGGGGNFGVVTSFLFKLHPVSTVVAGPTFWPLEQTSEVMAAYQSFITKAPEDVSGFLAFLTVPPVPLFPPELHNRKVCAIIWCSTAPPERADALTKSMRSVGTPLLDHVGPMPFPVLQSLFDPLLPAGLQWYWRADFAKEFSRESIAKHLEHASKMPAGLSQVHIYPINGAAHRVGTSDTAFSYRDANFAVVIVGVDPNPAKKDEITEWCKSYFDALHPYSAGGAYINFMMEEGQERVMASFRDNYARLAQVKAKYDPLNVFRVNQNIRPAAAAGA
ncbi:MAG TPA: FAD-binding oxidoreductase [Vicinamibacterales bacterium]|jgi:FAD/FMN-containing dehydrogenase|nr:FAD-binding oxidoreductase [Vicinamibacterales bacterium]